jgi:beta-lactamase class C
MLPTILDRALGLPPQRWLDVEPVDDLLYAERDNTPAGNTQTPVSSAGSDASASTAAPQ